ncbi:hypothetical protein CG51_19770 [Haematobacter missouriensis]|uniref:VPLPA-CTERM sorting domain-containing protein n=1 Tax=Haematobacter missouriensis TaxID=366616 RepID=A0A212AJF7_9RHOB|nr:VPLPA-CTERM sorting domain-containing protein [Haematobacter missouriensis]KFI32858.1 hypothetical protein CG51_19770 [Haematobacter missouriensis]OWJ77454.1 hypothetical protein CDV53_05865 [Haematobacter missouriensis]OWJ81619.1 hypothetical protein CDV52_16700 [Haematobacter missouriensis]
MRIVALVILACSFAVPCTATTLTFDDIPRWRDGPAPIVRQEGGVTLSADPYSDGVVSYSLPGALHLDDSGTSLTGGVNVTTGGQFHALGMSVVGYRQASYVFGADGWEMHPVPYDNIAVEGFRNGLSVAYTRFSTGLTGGAFNFAFGGDFRGIDMLRVAAIGPWGQSVDGQPIECGDTPCGHVDLDSLTIAPIPLPAGLALALGGMGALAGMRLLRRRGDA